MGWPVVSTDTLPVSQNLKDELEYLIKKPDEALNWKDQAADLLWDNTQIQAFENAAKRTYKMLCDELGADYEIEFYKRIF